ncbi:MAG: T9SS type A sorting domain-containing protein [Flavobacteriales bacterium]|nr:T9SS type A sorting domain-containing protein [Flavobacteriales bacterium]
MDEVAGGTAPAIIVVPNPVSSTATILLDEAFQGRVELVLVDASGREVRRLQRRSTTVVLDRSGLGGGLYVLHARDEAGHAATATVLIER